MEAQEAYTCQQILGPCHLPPQMDNQIKVEQKNPKSCRTKNGSHKSNDNRLKGLLKSVVRVSALVNRESLFCL